MSAFRVLCVGLLCSYVPIAYAAPPSGITFFSPRSQIVNSAQELIRDHQYIYQNYVVREHMFDITVGLAHSFAADRLATIIFGNSVLTVSGSELVDRNVHDLLADYFGLSPTFKSTVQILPKIENVIVPATLYYNLDPVLFGLYVRLQVPLVWNRSHVEMVENVIDTGTNAPFPAEYMAIPSIMSPYSSFTQALKHPTPFGAMYEPRLFGNLASCQPPDTLTIANITADLGWNYFFNDEQTSHLGIKFRVVTPNSTRPKNKLLYEPLAGNGHHWELGLGLNGHGLLWSPDDQQELNLYINLLITSILTSRQCRSFDLKNRPTCLSKFFSRYMLVKEFDEAGLAEGRLAPLINYSTLACDVSTPAQFDGSLMFAYTRKQLTFDIGYNGWIRTKENIRLRSGLPYNRLGLKGIQSTFTPTNFPSPVTESTATIFGAYLGAQGAVADPLSPQFINTQDIDPYSARSPLVLTHKIFTYLGYTWDELHKQCQLQPFIGLGAEFEFEGINDINDYEPPTGKNTMSQWSFWFRAGLLFG
jgi:hypothetical protein